MPYNGSGSFSIINSFLPNTTILSASVNQNFTDIATGLSDVLTRDGQAGMTAPLVGALGSVSLPSYTFAADLNTGLYWIGADNIGVTCNGAKVLDTGTTGLSVTGSVTASNTFVSAVGTVSLPGYTFTGDLDTGFYHIAANNIGIACAGQKYMDIGGAGGFTLFLAPVKTNYADAIPAGGNNALGFLATTTASFGVFFGSGTPSLSAAKGSLYLRSDGSTTNDRAYINTNGSTTWTALTTAA